MVSVKPKLKAKKEKVTKVKSIKKTDIKTTKKKVKKALKNIDEKNTSLKTESKTISKKLKYVMPSTYITEEVVDLCLSALLKLTTHGNKKNSIFGVETPIFVEIRCIKIPSSRGNVKFILPHSTFLSTAEVCLITPDVKKGKRIDHEPTIEYWQDILKEAGVSEIKTVLPLRQLKVEYDQFELKRRLLTQHDFIMVDTRVLTHASHLLGKMFFKKHNMLIPVKLNEKKNIKRDIDIGLRTAMLRLNEGHTSTILVGHSAMTVTDIRENILSLVKQFQTRYPGGEANIRAINLKLPLSLSLPLYLTLRTSNTVSDAKLAHKKPKHFTVLEDELSTIPDATVRVAPDGTVHVKQKENKSNEEGNITDEEEVIETDNEVEIEEASGEE